MFKCFSSSNDRYIKRLQKTAKAINALEPELEKLSDDALRARTDWFKKRLADGETLDSLLIEAFATVREAARRTLGQRHYDVQLIGGMVLHKGQIAEMKTGEGKTLVATLPVYLNALTGKGVHVVTVNDYLAKRDAEWMGQVYQFLGMTVGVIYHDLEKAARKEAYNCDITYGTNNELGFDYLRDNMSFTLPDMVQRPFSFALVDEVDSILIDEARTPLIISGQAEDSSERYIAVDQLMAGIKPEHFEKDEKNRQVMFTEAGNIYMEEVMQKTGLIQGSLYDIANVSYVHHAEQALKAHKLFERDVDYIVKDDKVVIIDEFTGRMMAGRRFSDGLHQALEAKEHVVIQAENQTLATITFQNYFRMYPKLAGMTGTAMTECNELDSTYKLQVVEIPTNVPVKRLDENDEIYATANSKYDAIIKEIELAHAKKQPMLVGTTSIEKSEHLADLLKKKTNIQFEVLNARHHEREAAIVAQAGAPGAVTIATNMAGRGTDIKLGGNLEMRLKVELEGVTDPKEEQKIIERVTNEIEEGRRLVLEAGGLYVIGTERHENRRIDNQLRGRSGRQGDPGRSKFFVSLQDDLMRIFGSERLQGILKTFRIPENEKIVHPWITKAIAKAQQKVETFYQDMRKNLLKFDDVMNEQRKVIYNQRKDLMQADSVSDRVLEMREEVIANTVLTHMPMKMDPSSWNTKGLHDDVVRLLAMDLPIDKWVEEGLSNEDVNTRLCDLSVQHMAEKNKNFEPRVVQALEKSILLQVVDQTWKEHLQSMDFLKHAIGLRAYGQRDPLNEYKRESFQMFADMLGRIDERVTMVLSHAQISIKPADAPKDKDVAPMDYSKIGRNEPCPCGSGKKFKHCHGAI